MTEVCPQIQVIDDKPKSTLKEGKVINKKPRSHLFERLGLELSLPSSDESELSEDSLVITQLKEPKRAPEPQ